MKTEMGPRPLWLIVLGTWVVVHGSQGQSVPCNMPVDVVILLDASDSIKDFEWLQEKDFVGLMLDFLGVERQTINVGMIVYSTEIGQVVGLQPFKTRAQLKALLSELVQTKEGTNTARAISRMRQMIQSQYRDGAKKMGVVITDGRSADSKATVQEANNARQVDGITMFAVGVGNEIFIDELREVTGADDPTHKRLFTVGNFRNLSHVAQALSDLICNAP